MKRLIVFGCSYAYGQGLPDCHQPPANPGKHPSLQGWPNIVGNKLGRIVINNSSPGSSNLEILHKVRNFKFEKDDICIIHWTFIERWGILEKGKYNVIGPWQNTTQSKGFYKNVYNDFTGIFLAKVFADNASYYLKNENIKYLSFEPIIHHTIRDLYEDYLEYDTEHKFKNLTFYHNNKLFPDADFGLDNAHPGPNTHKRFANYVIECLNE